MSELQSRCRQQRHKIWPALKLVAHLEARLGRIAYGWSRTPDGDKADFAVCRFEGGVFQGVLSFATIGLSSFALTAHGSGRPIHQELLICVRQEYGERNIPALLHEIGAELVREHRAILRGEVVGPRGIALPETQMEAVFGAIPVYFDDAFGAVTLETGDRVAISWLVPVTAHEARWVTRHGWRAFEGLLVAQDPDLFDPRRSGVRLPDGQNGR